MSDEKVKQGNRETRREAIIGLSLFAFFWVFIFGGIFTYLPFVQCQFDMSSDVGATCKRALQRGFLPTPLRSDVQNKIISAFRDAQNHEQVLQALADFEKLQPLDVGQLTMRGQAFVALQKRDEARVAYVSALTLAPDNEDAFINLISMSVEASDLVTARKDAADFVAENPTSSLGLQWSGWVENLDRQPDKAIAFYQKALAVSPDTSSLHYDLGQVYQRLGGRDRAIASYDKAIALNPLSSYTRETRGDLLAARGDHKAAQADYLAALEQYRDSNTLVALAKSYGETGELDKALPLMDEALTNSEQAEWVHEARIRLLANKASPEETLAAIDVLEKQLPASAGVMYGQGLLLEKAGKFEEAFEAYDNAAELRQYDDAMQLDVARMLMKLNRPKEALVYADKSISITDRFATSFMQRAQIHVALNNIPAAKTDYEAALKTEPMNLDVQRQVLTFFLGQGFVADAESHLETIRTTDPESQVLIEFEAKLKAISLAPP